LGLIGLGSNEGDRHATLLHALEELGRRPGLRVLRRSRFVETAPVGGPPGQGFYLNAAALVETSLEPAALLRVMLEVESALGRRRTLAWGPRTADLDLLLYDDVVRSTPALTLPHPRMAWRRFVLEPAAEVAASMVHPTTGWTIARLLEHLNTATNYVAITGPVAAGKTELARRISQSTGVRLIADHASPAEIATSYADPARNAWASELEFVDRRVRLLAARSGTWQEPARVWVSDFWLDQSLAFARVWFSAERFDAVAARLEEVSRNVVRPKLLVLLDRSIDHLLERIRSLGRPAAECWTREAIDRLREALAWCVARPDVGPVLRLMDQPEESMLREILAASEAMK